MPSSPAAPGLPVVVQLSFAGSRILLDSKSHPGVDEALFHDAVRRHLTERLRALPAELGLSDRHFVCGLSQLAIGADTLFTRACRDLSWTQRLLLPQHREDFLSAAGADGTPDFTDGQRQAARELLASPHVIQELVVSDSPDRHTRFHDVNLELVRLSDVVVCLVKATNVDRVGGTRELIDDAKHRKLPVLEIRVSVGPQGEPQFEEEWHHRDGFRLPRLPEELSGLHAELTGLPSIGDYCGPMKTFASQMADAKQTLFKTAALIIIGTHVLATLCAVIALKLHGAAALPWLLRGELLLLAMGLLTHWSLHRAHAARVWAMSRLVAEIARSSLALREVPAYLRHLFSLPLPPSLHGMLRTLGVLHLRETRRLPAESWAVRRDRYVKSRLTDAKSGQMAYYAAKLAGAANRSKAARVAFVVGSGCAFLATFGKLILVARTSGGTEALEAVLGVLAVVLPVIAVAALSLAASFDLEARAHTYEEMLGFLRAQEAHLANARSERAFGRLALETEARLLGETATWYSRRAFTGVT